MQTPTASRGTVQLAVLKVSIHARSCTDGASIFVQTSKRGVMGSIDKTAAQSMLRSHLPALSSKRDQDGPSFEVRTQTVQ